MQYIPFFRTKDRFEIYALLASNCIVDGYEWENGSAFFRFEDEAKCEAILAKLLSKKLKVYAHEMIDAIRTAQAIFNR